ncbi:MAG TPA: potassium transporter Kup [Pseudomonadota bacterium]|nr:potassium transporter Kup [Pseudomonadota bacterium]
MEPPSSSQSPSARSSNRSPTSRSPASIPPSAGHSQQVPPVSAAAHGGQHGPHHGPKINNTSDLLKVSLGALGVVYGDIGTSPLYALKECLTGPHGAQPTAENVLGILSLVFWSLTLVVVFKYITFITRADNQGEGGILALLAILAPRGATTKKLTPRVALVLLGLFGAALLYGDGVITPAVSVLGALEGLEVVTTAFKPLVVPLTIGILVGLFLVQQRGTAKVGALFGPVMMVWFACISLIGLPWIIRYPSVLSAVSPHHAVLFFAHHKLHGFLALGSVVLCITGGEALYADMGHFGRRSIRLAWYAAVFPALLLNYFGQGALMLAKGASITNPFYEMIPRFALYPMLLIATAAAIVASQALISGVFSLTRQAVQLGYWPRVTIKHTSGDAEGQIYVPEMNFALMIGCVWLVFAFRVEGSSGLAAAYGIAVTGTMGITSILFGVVAHEVWGWTLRRTLLLVGFFLVIDISFFAANLAKFAHGGWIPMVLALAIYVLMTTWKAGRQALEEFVMSASLPIDLFMMDLESQRPPRVKGTAVFMTSNPEGAPVVLLHHFKHNKVLHEQVVLLSVVTDRVPEVPRQKRVQVKEMGQGFYQVVAHYGFMQMPNVPDVLRCCREAGLVTAESDTSYYLGRETLLNTGKSGLWRWRKALFGVLSRNARPATQFFSIPPNRVVEMGAQIEI